MATSPLYDILLTIRDIATIDGMTTERLAMRRAIGDRTLKSYISQARHLGADIQSVRQGAGYFWVCRNWDDIAPNVAKWIDLEERGL